MKPLVSAAYRPAIRWRPLLFIAPFGLIALLLIAAPIPVLSTPTARAITMRAEQFEYYPGRIEVNQGDHVVITITSTDVIHGFRLEEYGINREIVPGRMQRIEFIADQVGKFYYRCSVTCGPLHPFMVGELVVNANVPYWRAAGFIVLTMVGMLVYIWQFKGGSDHA